MSDQLAAVAAAGGDRRGRRSVARGAAESGRARRHAHGRSGSDGVRVTVPEKAEATETVSLSNEAEGSSACYAADAMADRKTRTSAGKKRNSALLQSTSPDVDLTVHTLTDDLIRDRLAELEAKFGMPSSEFLERYNRGELGAHPAFIDWSGLLYIAARAGVAIPSPA